MASVGAVTCDRVLGQAAGLRLRVHSTFAPGVDGIEAQTLGEGDAPFRFIVDKRGTLSAVNTWVSSVEALQGTVVTITDDNGTAYTNMLIENLSQPEVKPYVDYQGSTHKGTIIVFGQRSS